MFKIGIVYVKLNEFRLHNEIYVEHSNTFWKKTRYKNETSVISYVTSFGYREITHDKHVTSKNSGY